MWPSQKIVVASTLLLLAAVIAVMTFLLSPVARWVPAIVILPTVTLLLFALVRELVSAHPLPAGGAPGGDSALNVCGERAVVAAVLLMPVLAYAVGLAATVFAFTCGYVRRRTNAGAAYSVLAGAAVALVVYALGGVVLGQRVLQGWLWMQLGVQP